MTASLNVAGIARFTTEDRGAVEELCIRAVQLIRSGAGIDSPELGLLIHAIWVLTFSIAERMCVGRTMNPQIDAADVADAFVDILLKDGLRSYDIDLPFLPYATKCIARLFFEKARRDGKRPFGGLPDCIADPRKPEGGPAKEEIRFRVRKAVRRLPRNLRRAVIARYWVGLCPRLAAARVGTKVSTFNGWTFRARKILRDDLSGEDFAM